MGTGEEAISRMNLNVLLQTENLFKFFFTNWALKTFFICNEKSKSVTKEQSIYSLQCAMSRKINLVISIAKKTNHCEFSNDMTTLNCLKTVWSRCRIDMVWFLPNHERAYVSEKENIGFSQSGQVGLIPCGFRARIGPSSALGVVRGD